MNLPKFKKPAFLRNNIEEMDAEAKRIHDYLITLEPGTDEYNKVQNEYMSYLDRNIKVEEVKNGKLKLVFWAVISVLVPVGYEWIQQNTESPHRLKALDKVPKNPPN